MKKTGKILTFSGLAAATAIAASLTACHETVYGPPPETVYGPPYTGGDEYDPSSNMVEDVYGPPVEDLDDASSDYNPEDQGTVSPDYNPEDQGTVSPDYNPEDQEVEVVYGPPFTDEDPVVQESDDFDPPENEIEGVYGPPFMYGEPDVPESDDFDPSENEVEDVYGPPPAAFASHTGEAIRLMESVSGQFDPRTGMRINAGKFSPEGNIPHVVYGPPPVTEESGGQGFFSRLLAFLLRLLGIWKR